MYGSTLLYGIVRQVRLRAMYYSLDSIMYGSTLLYGIVRQSTAEGDVLFARQDHV